MSGVAPRWGLLHLVLVVAGRTVMWASLDPARRRGRQRGNCQEGSEDGCVSCRIPMCWWGFVVGPPASLSQRALYFWGGVNGLSWLVGVAGGLGLCLMTIGPSLWAIGLAWSEKQIHLLRHGLVASGEVTATGEAERGGTESFWVEYRYEVAGQQYRRTLRDLGAWVSELEPGRPVHVLYRKKKPHQSTTWPPLGREPVRFNLSHLLEERKKVRELKASRSD